MANNFAEAFLGGRDRAIARGWEQDDRQKQSAFGQLAGQYLTAPEGQRQSLLGQMAPLNPQGAIAMDGFGRQQSEDAGKRLRERAAFLLHAPEAMQASAWQSMAPEAAQMLGIPELASMPWDRESFLPVLQQFAGGNGSAEIFAQKIGENGNIWNTFRDGRMVDTGVKADRQSWFANQPGVDPYIVRESGDVSMVGPGGAAPPQAPPSSSHAGGTPQVDSIMQAANAMIAAGIPSQQVEAMIATAMQSAPGVQVQPPGAQPAPTPTASGMAPPAPAGAPWVPITELGGGDERGGNPLRRPASTTAEETFGQPQAVTNPETGQVQMVQFGNRGNVRPVSGYTPAPTDRDNKPPTDGERAAAGYLNRMIESESLLQASTKAGYDPGNMRDYATAGQGPLLNWAASNEGQKYRQAQEDWVRAKLRKESGAVIGDDEMEREIRVYFPQPGDGADVIKQKEASRQQAIAQLRGMAGRAVPREASAPATPASGGGAGTIRLRYNPDTGDFE